MVLTLQELLEAAIAHEETKLGKQDEALPDAEAEQIADEIERAMRRAERPD